ncbi:NAD-dependent epimerase/dehydratase [Magnetococcus marinus MC-1]|uniref:NAD-dependent epimerase/dehydratase n=1 Tax=Magnetococcus marinus (strain ATCC BAA-1437 / JCM 17883 / MC-1) TaxID=156889 RepID=A0L6I8_MAGMM|nr:SDR family oxidoreductase [Magnetococcus marinus]ABK43581.1 NAD-dependent epimerase/dehydratase [Magnetococcus marinus MC-1]
MIALVTGGAGFIGSHLCEMLLEQGHTVRALDNFSTGRRANVAHLINHPKFTLYEGDIRDPETLVTPFQGVEWVFHLAGLADIVPSVENPTTYFEVNVHGTLNVLEFARRNQAKRLVYAASSSSYGIPELYPTPEESPIQPQYPYALTKYMGEELVLHWANVYKMPNLSLRMFNVYGPRSRTTGAYGAVFGVFLAQRLNNKPYTVVGDGQQSRDFTYVTDVCAAFYAAAQSTWVGEAFNVGSGGHQTINRLVELLGGEITYIPKRPGEPDCTFADTRKIHAKLNWQAQVSFEQGVANMLACIDDWRDAPVWEPASIATATASWFKHLGTP